MKSRLLDGHTSREDKDKNEQEKSRLSSRSPREMHELLHSKNSPWKRQTGTDVSLGSSQAEKHPSREMSWQPEKTCPWGAFTKVSIVKRAPSHSFLSSLR